MGIIDPTENANNDCNNWRELTSQFTNSIKQQEHRYSVSDKNIKNCKSPINPFFPNASFPYPLKTENLMGVEKGCIDNKWVKKKCKNKHLIPTSLREQIFSKSKGLNDIAQE